MPVDLHAVLAEAKETIRRMELILGRIEKLEFTQDADDSAVTTAVAALVAGVVLCRKRGVPDHVVIGMAAFIHGIFEDATDDAAQVLIERIREAALRAAPVSDKVN